MGLSLGPDVDEIQECGPAMRSSVAEFVELVSRGFIAFDAETLAEKEATACVRRFEEACSRAESAVSTITESNIATQISRTVDQSRDHFSVDIITHQRAMLRYNRRMAEYRSANPVYTRFLSPRAKRSGSDAWADSSTLENARSWLLSGSSLFALCVVLGIILFACSLAMNRSQQANEARGNNSRDGSDVCHVDVGLGQEWEAPKLQNIDQPAREGTCAMDEFPGVLQLTTHAT